MFKHIKSSIEVENSNTNRAFEKYWSIKRFLQWHKIVS